MQPRPGNVGRQHGRPGTPRRQTGARQQRATQRDRHARAVFTTKLPSPARRAGNTSRHYCRRAGGLRTQLDRQVTEERDRSQPPYRACYRRYLRHGQASPHHTQIVSYQDRSAVFARKKQIKGTKIVENLTKRRAVQLLAKARTTASVNATWRADGRIVCLLEDGERSQSTLGTTCATVSPKPCIHGLGKHSMFRILVVYRVT